MRRARSRGRFKLGLRPRAIFTNNTLRKWIPPLAGVTALLAIILLLPLILVQRFEDISTVAINNIAQLKPQETLITASAEEEQPIAVHVFLTEQRQTVNIPLEEYVRGVLAAEMPANFEHEALKAQAIAARTYIVRRLADSDHSSMPSDADPQAVVTDTVIHQAYLTEQKLKDKWGLFEYARNMDKLTKAVNETRGQIITYEGKPIHAVFFSTSDGYTENSEDYWSEKLPYLRSVESPWDQLYSPRYKNTDTYQISEVARKLGISNTKQLNLKIIDKSPTGKVRTIQAGGKKYTGREFREKLELPSTHFTFTAKGSAIQFTSIGYGHGVGMSQWGANGMAKQGKSAEDILRYYYSGIDISPLNGVL